MSAPDCDYCDEEECLSHGEPDWEDLENARYQYKTDAIHWGGMDIPS